MATTFNNFADVIRGFKDFYTQASNDGCGDVNGAPHGAFWINLTYEQFTTGNVPGVQQGGPWPFLVIGDSQNSNIIQILKGVGAAAKRFRQMPRPGPPYDPEQTTFVTALAAWIDAKCPNTGSASAGDAIVSAEETGDVQTPPPLSPSTLSQWVNANQTPAEFHVCMGLNSCAQQDSPATAIMAGTGQCSTVSHYCHGLNSCRGQGFCGGGGSTGAEQTEPGNNVCSGQGSCNALAGPNSGPGPQWYMNQASAPPNPRKGPLVQPPGPYYGQNVWHVARQLFETRMYEQGRVFVPDGKTLPPKLQANNCFGPSPNPDGPNPPPPDKPVEL